MNTLKITSSNFISLKKQRKRNGQISWENVAEHSALVFTMCIHVSDALENLQEGSVCDCAGTRHTWFSVQQSS